MIGGHCIRTWSATQKNITLSSAEAELVAAVKASAELIGAMQMASEWGEDYEGEVLVDSSAALGAVKRRGNGKLRHVRVGLLWVQEKAERDELKYGKVAGEENPADLMTKYQPKTVCSKLSDVMHVVQVAGRAKASLQL